MSSRAGADIVGVIAFPAMRFCLCLLAPAATLGQARAAPPVPPPASGFLHSRFRLRRGKKDWCRRCRYRMWSGNRPRCLGRGLRRATRLRMVRRVTDPTGPAPPLQSIRVRRLSHHRRQVFLPESLPRLSTSPTDRSRPHALSRPRHRHPKTRAPLASCCGRARGCDAGTVRIS